MIQKILVIVGLLLFINQIFKKFEIWDFLKDVGAESGTKWFYRMTYCRFCLLFHISCILTLIQSIFTGLNWDALLVPFVSMGLIQFYFKNDL